jgi:transcriptional regulator with XRE-family HTH domain
MVANERLRGCMVAAQLTILDVAAKVGVDPKTVERWITTDRIPHRTHRWATASLLKTDETYLWPETVSQKQARSASDAELLALYPDRGAVPTQLWHRLIDLATEGIDILVFAGLFLPDGNPRLAKVLASKAETGTRIRLALGDPDCDAVRLRGAEERIGDGLAARIRLSLAYLEEACAAPGVELRLHTTTLYNSVYRFDDDLLVNTHAYGAPAAQSPVMHLRRLPGGRLFDHYRSSFERVWELAQDWRP